MNQIKAYQQQVDIQEKSQQRLQQQGEMAQQQAYAPQLREQIAEAQAAVIAQTNPSHALKIILEGFKGNLETQSGGYENIGHRLMNDKGIARIASMLIPFVNDPMRFGDIKREEVRAIALQIANDITTDIGLNWREYDITDPTHKDIIVNALSTLILITLTRSEEGGEKRFLSSVVVEAVNGQQRDKKKSSAWERFKL